jgi:hypothetical protein
MNNKSKISNITSVGANSSYNPWEDKKIFVQDVGDIKSFLFFLEENEIETVGGEISSKNDENGNNNIITEESLELLKNLNLLSKLHFDKISMLEVLYEKYRNESILSKYKNYHLIDSINYLTETLRKFETNKIKIANLLHNTQFSENNIIKIKHQKKHEFITALKIVMGRLCNDDSRNELELINLSLNMHSETINKLYVKYEEISGIVDNKIEEYEKYSFQN